MRSETVWIRAYLNWDREERAQSRYVFQSSCRAGSEQELAAARQRHRIGTRIQRKERLTQ